MAKYFITPVLTEKAKSEIAFALANKQNLVFTRVVLGSGQHKTNLTQLTDVKTAVHTLQVSQSLFSDSNIRIVSRLDNLNITDTLNVNEIGVFAKVGNRPEFLYQYTWAEAGDTIPPRAEATVVRTYEFNTHVSTDGKLNVTFQADNNVYALQSDYLKVLAKVDKAVTDVNSHANDTTKYITASERQKWNAKADVTEATTNAKGLMSASDKAKLNDIQAGAQVNSVASVNGMTGAVQVPVPTKAALGLDQVINAKQATQADFDAHKADAQRHIWNYERDKWNSIEETGVRNRVEIEAGVDLNTLVTKVHYGLWGCNTSEKFNTLKNRPASAETACSLEVIPWGIVGYEMVTQRLTDFRGRVFVRRYYTYDKTFTDWQELGGITSGSNYIKFPDGTLICWGLPYFTYGDQVYTDRKTVTFPVSFAGDPAISVTVYLAPASDTYKRFPGVNLVDQNTRNFSFTVGDNSGAKSGSYMYAYWIAIGRWK